MYAGCGGDAVVAGENFGKVERVGETALVGGLADRSRAVLEEGNGVLHTFLCDVAGKGHGGFALEDFGEVVGVKPESLRGACDREGRVGKVRVDILDHCLHMGPGMAFGRRVDVWL